jgi:hypothetical protein
MKATTLLSGLARCVAVLLLVAAATRPAAGQGFDTLPLTIPVAFPNDSLPHTISEFLVILKHWTPSTQAHDQLLREHLYALIAQVAKERFIRTHATDLPTRDDTLGELFAWAHRLGVPGAIAVARALTPDITDSTPLPTPTFDLVFAASSFSLVAQQGRWMAHFPYYFMIGMATRQHLNNGLDDDVATLSTLTAANALGVGGASQATILLASAQTKDAPTFTAFWLVQLGITLADTAPKLVPQAIRAFRAFDAAANLWKELVVLQIPSGSLIVAYVGLDGTYQANRPHFLDLLGSLRVR